MSDKFVSQKRALCHRLLTSACDLWRSTRLCLCSPRVAPAGRVPGAPGRVRRCSCEWWRSCRVRATGSGRVAGGAPPTVSHLCRGEGVLQLLCRRHRRSGFNPWRRKDPLEEGMATHSSVLTWLSSANPPSGGSPHATRRSPPEVGLRSHSPLPAADRWDRRLLPRLLR